MNIPTAFGIAHRRHWCEYRIYEPLDKYLIRQQILKKNIIKIRTYSKSIMFDFLGKKPVEIANYEKSKSPKPPSLIYLTLEGKRGKTCNTS